MDGERVVLLAEASCQLIARTTPPSTRRAAPFVDDARLLLTYTIIAATSSGELKRCRSDDGRTVVKNSRSNVAASTPSASARSATTLPSASVAVGPGRTLLTVTPLPTVVSARPRATASCAVFVMP